MATFEYEIGMSAVPRRTVHAAMVAAGMSVDEAWTIIDGWSDGKLRYEYGRIRSANRKFRRSEPDHETIIVNESDHRAMEMD